MISGKMRCWLVIAAVLCACPRLADGVSYAFPRGLPQPCFNEGQNVELGFIKANPCITCKCMGGLVMCDRERCPNNDACHLVLLGKKINSASCCEQCKGCAYKGRVYGDGEEWTDPGAPCMVSICYSGIITQTRLQCETGCSSPLPALPGQCCPRCPGCQLNTTSSVTDNCTRCTCDPDTGQSTCSRAVCPALPCPPSKTVCRAGQCCPKCRGVRRVRESTDQCQTGRRRVGDGHKFSLDACTSCRCEGSTGVCRRRHCSPPPCPPSMHVTPPGRCCAICRQPERVRRDCRHKRRVIQDGATWKMSACRQCSCRDGEIRCQQHTCPELSCPEGFHLTRLDGQCCKQCVEDDAVCTVFGDPHYKTFDGKLYNFQGTCRYMLAKDCVGENFSVRVANDPKNSQFYSWTKTAFIKVGDLRITLKQKLKVKVNGKAVTLPHVVLGEATIYQNRTDNYNIAVRLSNIGVSITWDGDSFLQLSVPPLYKRRMCGLCGNYNGKKEDDFMTKRGRKTKQTSQFARSWRVGGSKFCSVTSYQRKIWRKRRKQRHQTPSIKSRQARARAIKLCSLLKSPSFAPCHRIVHPASYFKSCVQDMRECGTKEKCYCEAATAYAHECNRHGVSLVNWVNQTHCGVERFCTEGEYMPCANKCQRTCTSATVSSASATVSGAPCSPPSDASAACTPGCVCPAGRVLIKDRCMDVSHCPR